MSRQPASCAAEGLGQPARDLGAELAALAERRAQLAQTLCRRAGSREFILLENDGVTLSLWDLHGNYLFLETAGLEEDGEPLLLRALAPQVRERRGAGHLLQHGLEIAALLSDLDHVGHEWGELAAGADN